MSQAEATSEASAAEGAQLLGCRWGLVAQPPATDAGVLDEPGLTVAVPVGLLDTSQSFRVGGLCAEQVDRLVALGGAWPPIVIEPGRRRVIDGAHRVAAARRLGYSHVQAELFHGSPDEAFVEFVRRNVTQGLVLSLAERKHAAVRILRTSPIWSDRRIAELCVVSPKTVARLRSGDGSCPSEDAAHSDDERRVGRDLRVRPVRRGSVRALVIEAVRAQPKASLRTIAASVGVSPETVRLVRRNLAPGGSLVDAGCDLDPAPSVDDGSPTDTVTPWHCDAALASSERGEEFTRWFESTHVDDTDLSWVDAVPLGRVYVVAEVARQRSEIWLRIARALEARPARAR